MTTYTTITNSEIDQDSPVTQPLMTALRDNMIAITEGSTGAPKIQTAAIASDAVTTDKIATGAVLSEVSLGAAGAVGTYAFLMEETVSASTSYGPGDTHAGSTLNWAGIDRKEDNGSARGLKLTSSPSGTWRCMGYQASTLVSSDPDYFGATLWMRIA